MLGEQCLEKKINWEEACVKMNKVKEIKLKWFQIRIMQRILVTNSILSSMGISASNQCNFCLQERDNVLHYLCNCVHVEAFWTDYVNLLKRFCMHCDRLTMSKTLILFGKEDYTRTDEGFDFILLHAKLFIYKCRINKTKPRIEQFRNELRYIYNIDKHVHLLEMSLEKFNRKWMLYLGLLD